MRDLELKKALFLPTGSFLSGRKGRWNLHINDDNSGWKGLWERQSWEWDREMNSCWCKNTTHLFDKLFKMLPPSKHTHTHPFWQYTSFLSLQPENTLTHEPLGVYLKPPTSLGGIIFVNLMSSYYSERLHLQINIHSGCNTK